MFRELLVKFDLDVFLPDIIICCTFVHDMLLDQSLKDIKQFMEALQEEGLNSEFTNDEFKSATNDLSNVDNRSIHLTTRFIKSLEFTM